MKTSNKLLIAFGGWIFAMMLFSAIILRVNYSKGITNQPKRIINEVPVTSANIPAFKVLIVNGSNTDITSRLNVNQSASYKITGASAEQYHVNGDTLFINGNSDNQFIIECPSVESIKLNSPNWEVSVSEFKGLSKLSIKSETPGHTSIYNSEVRSLLFAGAPNSTLDVGEQNKIDSADITMRKHSNLYFRAANQYADIKVDSLDDLQITGNALQSIKSIK